MTPRAHSQRAAKNLELSLFQAECINNVGESGAAATRDTEEASSCAQIGRLRLRTKSSFMADDVLAPPFSLQPMMQPQ